MDEFLKKFTPALDLPKRLRGAILPHAGWMYSGPVAAKTLSLLSEQSTPNSCIIFGADHRGVAAPTVYPDGAWWTPLGPLAIDEATVNALELIKADDLMFSAEAHEQEHAIEVLAPMLKYFWPDITIVPITVPPVASPVEVGRLIADLLKDRRDDYIFLASSDLTHYGESYGWMPAGLASDGFEWMKKNDRQIIDLIIQMEGNRILDEVDTHQNACGPGAMAALVSAMSSYGIGQGHLVEYHTSHGDLPAESFQYGVGYGGIVF